MRRMHEVIVWRAAEAELPGNVENVLILYRGQTSGPTVDSAWFDHDSNFWRGAGQDMPRILAPDFWAPMPRGPQ